MNKITTNILTITDDMFDRLQAQLHRLPASENLAIGFLTLIETSERREFLLRDDYLPEADDYAVQSAGLVSLKAEKLAGVLHRSRDYRGVLLAHNHLGDAFFSPTDETGVVKFAPRLADFRRDAYWLQFVSGSDGICARVGDTAICEPIDRIKIIGTNGIRLLTPLNSRLKDERIVVDEARHDRTLNLLGERGPATIGLLQSLSFGLIGAGGVMSAFANVFKFFGPRRLVVVDDDHVERSNANRLFGYRFGDESISKSDLMRRELLAFDPGVQVEAIAARFPDEDSLGALKACDIWIAGPDNHYCRYWATYYASRYGKPLLEFGSGIRVDKKQQRPVAVGSHLRFQLPTRDGKCLICNGLNVEHLMAPAYEALNSASGLATGYIQNSDLPAPASVVTINTVAATLGSRTLLAYLSGIGSVPTYIEYDELSCQLRNLSNVLPKAVQCPICGRDSESVWAWGDELPPHLRVMEAPEEVNGHVLCQ